MRILKVNHGKKMDRVVPVHPRSRPISAARATANSGFAQESIPTHARTHARAGAHALDVAVGA
jgi:hypothetical protein